MGKALAIELGVQIALLMKVSPMVLLSDAKAVVQYIEQGDAVPWEICHIISDVRVFVRGVANASPSIHILLQCVPRANVALANLVTKKAADMGVTGSNEESEKVLSRQRTGNTDRSALIDITNDSPIVGLALGSLETPSLFSKKRNQLKQTPGTGEALLRGQVKTLLQKVEEEAELSKLSFEHRPFLHLQGVVDSPSGLLAPTPANTPHILNLSCNGDIINSSFRGLESKTPQEVADIIDGMKQETLESQKSLITRSLLFDFSEKSEISDSSGCSSVLTYQEGSKSRGKPMEEDDASIWSIQVNASTQDVDEEKEEDGGSVDELCEWFEKIGVGEKRMPQFTGKHTRFVFNGDDEIEGVEEVEESSSAVSPGILRLKGMPTPEGKHLRFQEEEDD
ncbi:hypothetical protein HHK36_002977 [Tetracentron sinense]|uniref:Uncharacterized protein n=1 Tax=Tetracentron sinense TaxID=13715 RepID=A0A835DNH3_TETSI|nr:hypothetical protein HHK36_002977 [Tetracentron sinense]